MNAERPPLWIVLAVYAWAVAAFAVILSMHLLAGVFEYRRTMQRPWPDVPPLADDDDE